MYLDLLSRWYKAGMRIKDKRGMKPFLSDSIERLMIVRAA